MKIGLVYSPELNIGGVERHLLDLIAFLQARQTEVVLFSNTSETFRNKLHPDSHQGVEVQPWQTTSELISLIQDHQPDLLHFHSPIATLQFFRTRPKNLNIPVIETKHLSYVDFFAGNQKTLWRKLRGMYFKQEERLINRTLLSKSIFVSKSAMQKAIDSGDISAHKAVHIANAVDVSRFQQSQRKAYDKNTPPVLICTSRLNEQKGQKLLIDALREISLPWELWLVGSGPQEDYLKSLVDQYQISQNIRFWGYQEDVPGLLSQADIYVLPSLVEAAPYGLLEAMACGLPCIASSVGDVKEWIHPPVNGLLVSPGDVSNLNESILSLLSDPSKWHAMGQAAAESIKNQHAPHQVFSAVFEEYQRALALNN